MANGIRKLIDVVISKLFGSFASATRFKAELGVKLIKGKKR
jgi:hypothetical protein